MNDVLLADLVQPVRTRAGRQTELPIYSVTKHRGFVPSLEYFSKQVFSREVSDYRLVEPGEFAYATIHLDEGSIGIAPERALISPMYTVFRVNQTLVEPTFLLRFLKSPKALTQYARLGKGTIHRRMAISLDALGTLRVPLPPIDGQRRIAAILDQADVLRAKRRQVLAHLDALTQSIFHDMFGDPGEWPDRWSMATIGDAAASVQYGTSAKAGAVGAWPILRMGNITDRGRIDSTDLKYLDLADADISKYTVRRGDLLFNRTNSAEKVGKAAVVRDETPFALAGYLVRVRMRPIADPEFVSAYLGSDHGRAIRRGMAKLAVNQANISASELKKIPIALPPMDLQRRFARLVAKIESQRSRIEASLAKDGELFEVLQSRAFSGQL